MAFAFFTIQIALVLFLSPLCIGAIRKVKALMQNRHGASIFQPYRNLSKLFGKDEVVSHDASWIFLVAPYVVFASTLVIASSIPLAFVPAFAPAGDFLVVIYMVALGAFFLSLAGMDPASAFGGTGSSREMTLAAVAEGGLLFTLLVPALIAGSTHIATIAAVIGAAPFSQIVPLLVAFVGFFIVLLSENARYPFDNPSTHLELTMVHEAMILEYSGKRLALMEWAAANKLFIFLALAANLFFPSTIGQGTTLLAMVMAGVFTLLKVGILTVGIAVIESSIAKLRYFRLPDLLFTSFVMGVIALIISLAV
ncbi:MAG: NADH-quinone oxidoreductase subunit H [Candidatus Uhrbacteria bacterium]|nr:NADH-quinone oxidoreductase subunit H [Candidatus Uhrbacteria bacterium]